MHRTFRQLLEELEAEHDRQLAGVRDENRDLKQRLRNWTNAGPGDFDSSRGELEALRAENQELRERLRAEAPAQAVELAAAAPVQASGPECQRAPSQGRRPSPPEISPEAPPCNGRRSLSLRSPKSFVTTRSGLPGASKPGPLQPGAGADASLARRPSMLQARPANGSSTCSSSARLSAEWSSSYLGVFGPTSNAKLKKVIESNLFEAVVGILIVANTAVMAVEMQYLGLEAGYVTGFEGITSSAEESWPGARVTFQVVERIFTAVFTLELCFRMYVLRCGLLKVPLNWIDVAAVAVGLLDWAMSFSPVNPVLVRLLRLGKFARGIRIVMLAKVLESLTLLLKCIRASVTMLFWSLCVLVIIQCIVGMAASQIVRGYIMDLSNDEEMRHLVYSYYGTFTRAMITMFEVHLANWAPACRVLIDSVGEWSGGLFVFYRCFIGFAVLNVINAVFIQQTMGVASQDNDIMILQKQRASEHYKRKLLELFHSLDTSGDGLIDKEEFHRLLHDPSLKAWMSALHLDPVDMEGLFEMLDTGTGEISAGEFVLGASRLQGPAKNIDMAQLLAQTSRIERRMEHICHGRGRRAAAAGGPLRARGAAAGPRGQASRRASAVTTRPCRAPPLCSCLFSAALSVAVRLADRINELLALQQLQSGSNHLAGSADTEESIFQEL